MWRIVIFTPYGGFGFPLRCAVAAAAAVSAVYVSAWKLGVHVGRRLERKNLPPAPQGV